MPIKAELWWPKLVAGDIVWCHFPHLPALQPGPKPRPALVMRVFEDTITRYRVLVAYGTSQKLQSLRAGEFSITARDSAAYHLSGLSFGSKFSLKDVVELAYNAQWFKVPPHAPHGQLPKIGMLHPSLVQRAALAWKAVNP
jgi:hypothetical protein